MSYFPVKTGGARTSGGGITKPSGSFASLGSAAIYADRGLAIADGAGSGDIVIVSDAHIDTSPPTMAGPTTGDFLRTIVVEDLNCDVSVTSTSANESSSADISHTGRHHVYGIYYSVGDDFIIASSNSMFIGEECTFHATGTGDKCISAVTDGVYTKLINSKLSAGNAGVIPVVISNGAIFDITGGALIGTAVTKFISSFFVNGGGALSARGFDLTNLTSGYVLNGVGGGAADDNINVSLYDCPVNAGLTGFVDETFISPGKTFEAYGCAAISEAKAHQFHIEGYGGFVDDQDDAGIHRDESEPTEFGIKVSMHCVTNANASIAAPFNFKLTRKFVALSGAKKKLRFYIASETALTDLDVFIQGILMDGTTKHIPVLINTRNSDRLAVTGTALPTDSGSTWKDGASDLTGYYERYIEIDTTALAVSDGVIDLGMYVTKPSIVLYVCTKHDQVA
ncbi:MAG: hypothetical protein COB36_10625 [Alphaproteobacteria bacterium]|nr:MAG: hypothetical protein COB36_10625 [Alphaproteobacteria bacterium]